MDLKVNLQCGTNILNGYININTFAPQNIDFDKLPANTSFFIGNFKNIDQFVEDNNCLTEIRFNPPLNILDPNEIVTIMAKFLSKLKDNGTMSFYFVDNIKLAHAMDKDMIGLDQAFYLTFGHNYEFRSIMTIKVLQSICKQIDAEIKDISSDNVFVTMNIGKYAKDIV